MERKYFIILLGVVIVIAGCVSNPVVEQTQSESIPEMRDDVSAEDQAMIEHCKMMPQMRGCEKYIDNSENGHMRGNSMMQAQEGFLPAQDLAKKSFPKVKSTSIIDVKDGETVDINADIVTKEINGKEYTMYGYNGQIPGPALRVKQGSSIIVNFKNNIDWDTTVHWHGLRHDIKDDGVPDVSQMPVKPGESYTYTLYFPDNGVYWYHPHIREDLQQDMGLAGNILVFPSDGNYYNSVNREELIILDDILIHDGDIVPYGKEHANYVIMGRYGNVLLTNGETNYNLEVQKGETVRFYVTNVANARPYNFLIEGAKMKLVGGDLGLYENEEFVDSVIISPAERYIIEVYFEKAGEYLLKNTHPDKSYTLGKIIVSDVSIETTYDSANTLRSVEQIKKEIGQFKAYFNKPVDYELALTIDMPSMGNMMAMMGDDHEDIEWEDDMGMMNSASNSENVKWILKDTKTGKENMDIGLTAKKGDKIKIRLFNDPESAHPMQHPIHLHGQRFLVLSEDGKATENFVWKDTVLVPIGKTVDILVDVTNPGEWMMHCHIAEHLEAGMMTSLEVA